MEAIKNEQEIRARIVELKAILQTAERQYARDGATHQLIALSWALGESYPSEANQS